MVTQQAFLMKNGEPELDVLSKSDLEALQAGFERSRGLTFTERIAATHGDNWQAANLGLMCYENMMEDGPEKAERVAYL